MGVRPWAVAAWASRREPLHRRNLGSGPDWRPRLAHLAEATSVLGDASRGAGSHDGRRSRLFSWQCVAPAARSGLRSTWSDGRQRRLGRRRRRCATWVRPLVRRAGSGAAVLGEPSGWARGRFAANHGDDSVDLDGRAFGSLDLSQHAGHRRRNLRIHFVGGDFEERLVLFNAVAGFLSHLVMVPSKIDSPICGITTSVQPGAMRRGDSPMVERYLRWAAALSADSGVEARTLCAFRGLR